MSILSQSYPSLESMIQSVFQNETDAPTFIMPSLELKKSLVEKLAFKFGTVPDDRILRLNEFFSRQVQELAPEIQFLDKDLLGLLLKMQLQQVEEFKKYMPFIDVALDYISIFAPILGRDHYRQALEEFIQSDELFLRNYGDIYPFLVRLWDRMLNAKQLLPAWSLGWLFLNLGDLGQKPKTIYILGFNKLKSIEKELFEELAHSWQVIDVTLQGPSVEAASKSAIYKLVSPMDEVQFCLQQYKDSSDAQSINIIAPKSKWFYKNILETYLAQESNTSSKEESLTFREQVHAFLSPVRLQAGQYEYEDLKRVWFANKHNFKNEQDFQKSTTELFESTKLIELDQHLKDFKLPDDAVVLLDFLDTLIKSHSYPERFDKVLRKIYPIALQTPKNIRMDVSSWLQFLSLKLDKVLPSLSSKTINFYTPEEVRWVSGETNIFLSCTRQDYDKSPFAYLTEYETEKLSSDLGFNLEGLSPLKSFEEELERNAHANVHKYFLVPEFDFIGTSQQPSQIIQNLEKQGVHAYTQKDVSWEKLQHQHTLEDISRCNVQNFKLKELSASSLQMYIDRPYEYFLNYVLKLKDEEPINVDPSSFMSGTVLHALLAQFLDQEIVDTQKMRKVIEEHVQKDYQFWSNTKAAEVQISRQMEAIQAYIQTDMERKARTQSRTLALEQKFEAYFDIQDLRFYKTHQDGRIKFTGVIDRIDECQGHLYILDYKSGKAQSLKNNITTEARVQMPLYAMILQDRILDLEGELAGLQYVSIGSQFEEVPALMIRDFAEKYLEKKLHHQTKAGVSQEGFVEVIDEYREFFKYKILDIQNQKFGSWWKDYSGQIHLVDVDF